MHNNAAGKSIKILHCLILWHLLRVELPAAVPWPPLRWFVLHVRWILQPSLSITVCCPYKNILCFSTFSPPISFGVLFVFISGRRRWRRWSRRRCSCLWSEFPALCPLQANQCKSTVLPRSVLTSSFPFSFLPHLSPVWRLPPLRHLNRREIDVSMNRRG